MSRGPRLSIAAASVRLGRRTATQIIEVARLSALFPPEGIADVEATLDAFFAGTTDGDQWVVTSTENGIAVIACYAPERLTENTWNLYLLAVHPQH